MSEEPTKKKGLPAYYILIAMIAGVAASISFTYIRDIHSLAYTTRSIDRHLATIERYLKDIRDAGRSE